MRRPACLLCVLLPLLAPAQGRPPAATRMPPDGGPTLEELEWLELLEGLDEEDLALLLPEPAPAPDAGR